ncbi:hypothetical protein ALO95_101194 [Pseudomonas syringae pv. antirrhini]|uniref:Uncharacterized protein n=1 Tax=Pseudomonas syringae pv. antirrhini TaxID=251702 RepID=A0A0P9J9M0_9PSED|nr:hypothetical protein ALO87_101319 [Pseudomonas syringae pv. apii]KPW46690.1 hypothetical protein ALO88_101416 [Pseudomonas syringae pv. antirrhini]RMQ75630.1 hypothetical protein ALQ00_101252 [Pseudomonas syringae pv. tomato]RMR19433.1 hypothetical protein ALP89_101302 [Pseudomonas syringae pv. persicae]RMP36470.1 hypothetical protein ALQ24_101487 [Pseudomonas syringae pv. antirrhini]
MCSLFFKRRGARHAFDLHCYCIETSVACGQDKTSYNSRGDSNVTVCKSVLRIG